MEPLVRASLAVRTLLGRGHGLLERCALGAYVVYGGATAEFGARRRCAALGGVGAAPRVAPAPQAARHGRRAGCCSTSSSARSSRSRSRRRSSGSTGASAAASRRRSTCSSPSSPRSRGRCAGILVVAWLLGLEAALRARRRSADDRASAASRRTPCFVGAFALLNLALLRAEVARIRATARARVEAQLVRLKEDARSYRLLGAGEAADREEVRSDRLRARQRRGDPPVGALRARPPPPLARPAHRRAPLAERRRHAPPHQRALDGVGRHPRRALRRRRRRARRRPRAARAACRSTASSPSYKVPYYAGPVPGARARRHPGPRRRDAPRRPRDRPPRERRRSRPHEEEIAAQAARFCLRAIQNERVFLQLERAKVEQGKLYRAAQALGAALSEKDVVEAGVQARRARSRASTSPR